MADVQQAIYILSLYALAFGVFCFVGLAASGKPPILDRNGLSVFVSLQTRLRAGIDAIFPAEKDLNRVRQRGAELLRRQQGATRS